MPGPQEFSAQEILNRSFDPTNNLLNTSMGAGAQQMNDDVIWAWGTGSDIASINRSSTLSANAEVTSLIIGTSVHPGVAANSLILSNITASGDMLLLTNRGGNSETHILLDGSLGDTVLYARGVEVLRVEGSSANVLIANSSGVVIGHTAQETISIGDGATDLIPEVQILGTGQVDGSVALFVFSTTATRAGAPTIALVKGGNATIGSHTVLADNEVVGSIIGYGDDGTDLETPVGSIQFVVDDSGGPGTGAIGGSIEFYTTADGGETLTLGMTLTTGQRLAFNDAVIYRVAASVLGLEAGDSLRVPNDAMAQFGDDPNQVILNRSTALNADTALTTVLVGTPVSEAVAADTLMISNTTTAGDIAMYGSRGGNSEQFLFMDVSAGVLYLTPYEGGLTIGLAANPPAPDRAGVHIWTATAGSITAHADSVLIVETGGNAAIQFLTPTDAVASIRFGDTSSTDAGQIRYDHDNTRMVFAVEASDRLFYSAAAFAFQEATTVSTTAGALTITPTTDTLFGNGTGVVIGHTAQVNINGELQELQVLGTGSVDSSMVLGNWKADRYPPRFIFAKSRHASIGSFAIVSDNDYIGEIKWMADDGNDWGGTVAIIRASIDGTPGSDDLPGRLEFHTTGDGENNPSERWRIHSVGYLTSIAADAANAANADGGIVATGGIAFTDVANAWIDDATHGSGTVTHYIGNQTIDTTASDKRLKENFSPPNGLALQHLNGLAYALEEYDYIPGMRESGRFVGFAAQSLYEVLPQYVVVGADEDDMWGVHYKYMVGDLIWGWSDHEARLTTIEADDWLKEQLRAKKDDPEMQSLMKELVGV